MLSTCGCCLINDLKVWIQIQKSKTTQKTVGLTDILKGVTTTTKCEKKFKKVCIGSLIKGEIKVSHFVRSGPSSDSL